MSRNPCDWRRAGLAGPVFMAAAPMANGVPSASATAPVTIIAFSIFMFLLFPIHQGTQGVVCYTNCYPSGCITTCF